MRYENMSSLEGRIPIRPRRGHHTSLFNPANPVILSSAFYLFKLQRKQSKQRVIWNLQYKILLNPFISV